MRAYFPDTKSASLACEQLVGLGLPLHTFKLSSRAPVPAVPARHAVPQHVSILHRLSVLFGSGSPSQKTKPAPAPSADPGEAILTIQADDLGPEAREIIRQHGGYVEPVPSAR